MIPCNRSLDGYTGDRLIGFISQWKPLCHDCHSPMMPNRFSACLDVIADTSRCALRLIRALRSRSQFLLSVPAPGVQYSLKRLWNPTRSVCSTYRTDKLIIRDSWRFRTERVLVIFVFTPFTVCDSKLQTTTVSDLRQCGSPVLVRLISQELDTSQDLRRSPKLLLLIDSLDFVNSLCNSVRNSVRKWSRVCV